MKASLKQRQLVLPLLDALEHAGGGAKTGDLYDRVAETIDLAPDLRDQRIKIGDSTYNIFERSVRWAQQRAKLMGLAQPEGDHRWTLTSTGAKALREAVPGFCITIFTTDKGVALFGRCEDAVAYIDDTSVQLLFSSPPYPLIRKKDYGNEDEKSYVDWFLRIAEQWPRILTGDGSVVLNLGDAWRRGEPVLSLYQERLLIRLEEQLGLKLCQKFSWNNPSKMPSPAEWVTVRRVRCKSSVEQILWLSPTAHPYADNKSILVPYSEAMKKRLAAGGETSASRPSGYQIAAGAFGTDNGGAIPGNLITAANTESSSAYIAGCKAAGLPVHPARFPAALPEHFIKFLTKEQDLVFDPFGGSLTTAAAAERLNRRWIASEAVLDYLEGARLRFPDAVAA